MVFYYLYAGGLVSAEGGAVAARLVGDCVA
jgi:hypothetical protein